MFEVYCDIDFLIKFYKAKPKKDIDDALSEEEQIWVSLCNFFYKDVKIYINKNFDDIKQMENEIPFIRKMLNLWITSKIELQFSPDLFEQFEKPEFINSYPYKIFFIESHTDILKKYESVSGLKFINFESYQTTWKSLYLQKHKQKVNNKGEIKNWTDFKKFKHRFNSIIIVDRYIFKNSNYQKNIKQFFKSIFPTDQQNFMFDITILCEIVYKNFSISEINNYIESFLKEHNSSIRLNMSIIKTVKIPETHDRRIFTNYFYFESGNSFDYENNINTNLHVDSLMSNDIYKNAINTFKDYSRIINGVENVQNEIRYTGNKQNRLLN